MKKYLFLIFTLVSFTIDVNAQFSKIFDFPTGLNGSLPRGSLISDGTYFYGTTVYGGVNGYGIIFKIKPDGTNFSKIFDFDGTASGKHPRGSLLFDGTYMYGMTQNGGSSDKGVVFKIKTDGTNFVKLLDFNGANGYNAFGSLISDGVYLYGLTIYGGNGYGVAFKIKPDGTGYTKLLDFADTSNGAYPNGDFIFDGNYLYATTAGGGANYQGTVFKIKPDGSDYTKLFDCAGSPISNFPYGSLISDGTYLYGLSGTGGTYGFGTAFKIKPDGTGYTKIYDFDGANGRQPMGTLIFDGLYLYGMTQFGGTNNYGIIFKIKTDGSDYTKLFDFTNLDGVNPQGALTSDGIYLYGMTTSGGSSNGGVIFKMPLSIPTGIEKNYNSNSISIFPNPSNGIITININSLNLLSPQIEIKNTLGELVHKSAINNSKTIIDLKDKPNGIYYVNFIQDNEVIKYEKIAIIP